MRCITLIFLILSLSILMEKNVFSQEKTSITRVVIDAGHGGKDPGTIGKKSQEKNVVLQIALKLGEEIRSQCKGVTVICTRTTDEFIELHERAEIANRSKADLFISIHCNANPKHTFQGAETYVMGLHRTEANLEIAKKENAAILMEPDYSINYNGFDPNSDESYITFTLFQNAFLEQSTWFASIVQDEMKDRVGMYDRGVRQAGFLVLYKTTMPSVLIETGFLSNPEEEKFLMSQKGQQYISSAICRAFRKFKAKMEGNGKELASLNEKKSSPSSAIIKPPVEQKVTSPSEAKPKETLTKETAKPKEKPRENPLRKDTLKPKSKSKTHAEKRDSIAPKENLAANTVKHEKAKGKTEEVKRTPAKPADEVLFRIQIATSPKELSTHSKKFAGLPEIWRYQHQGLYKYTAGKESSPEALAGLMGEAKKMGFTDAFIVAFHGEERITVAEAKKLISAMQK
ncbi:MAG TPA: N-acetylmuramoyl-L-alanine amidase [Bacteroidales bacterium]|nr:N-acetylmuramoyl-L-alanine amidase [Bacteroidales bacterium]